LALFWGGPARAADAGSAWVEEEAPDVPAAANASCLGQPAFAGDAVLVGDECLERAGNVFHGGVHVLRREGDRWRFTGTTLTASDGTVRDAFGTTVAVAGDTAVIGSRGVEETQTPTKPGAVYVFTRSASGWVEQQKLVAPDAAPGDLFGEHIAISGNTIAIGARAKDVQGNSNQGALYVFVRSGTTWSHQATLTALMPAPRVFFGTSFAIQGDTLLVGDASWKVDQRVPGAVHAYQRTGSSWAHTQTVVVPGGMQNESFGCSIALDGNTALAGSLRAFNQRGAAYPLQRSGTSFQLGATFDSIPMAGVGPFPWFGQVVALEGDTAFVGGPSASTRVDTIEGVVLAYRRSGTSWLLEQMLVPVEDDESNLGRYIALSGDRALLVGKRLHAYHRAGEPPIGDAGSSDAASGGSASDAGVTSDGSGGAPPAAAPRVVPSESGGCGCRTPPRGGRIPAAAFGIVLLAAVFAFSRRAR
jgi:hypothetical protein